MESILIIDNEEAHRVIFRVQIENAFGDRFRVFEADNSHDSIEIIVREKPVCIVLDHVLRGETGMQIVHQFKRDIPDCPPIILVTCALTEELRRDVMALGAEKCLLKSGLSAEGFVNAVKEVVGGE